MDLTLELRVLSREADRIQCAVTLAPEASSAQVDGVAVQLVRPLDGVDQPLGARALLPVAGRLDGPITLNIELRSEGPLPSDAWLVGAMWSGRDGLRTRVPARPPPSLRDYLRGRLAPTGVDLSPVLPADDAMMARVRQAFPWIDEPIHPSSKVALLEGVEPVPPASDLAERFDLGEEEASWLRDLLAEDDEA